MSQDEDCQFQLSDAMTDDLPEVKAFLLPFMEADLLLPRDDDELNTLLACGVVARDLSQQIVGFAAVEIYSKKLSELQCLAVSTTYRRRGVGRALVKRCVDLARECGVRELMAISASDELFMACGFDYSLPNQKRALFIQPND